MKENSKGDWHLVKTKQERRAVLPATMPETMVARIGVFVRVLILDKVRNSSPSSAIA